jgi:hypothetical protein
MQAVITADIVNSTKMDPQDFQVLTNEIQKLYTAPNRIEFYRGDSFQALITDAKTAYKNILLSRLKAISYSLEDRIDIRISISLGIIKEDIISNLGSHLEEVFINSGRAFDQFSNQKSERFLLITCGNKTYDISYELLARYTDSLLSQISAKQAITLYYLFLGKSQKETAALLNKSKPTINKQVKAARFEELMVLLNIYETLTKETADGK